MIQIIKFAGMGILGGIFLLAVLFRLFRLRLLFRFTNLMPYKVMGRIKDHFRHSPQHL